MNEAFPQRFREMTGPDAGISDLQSEGHRRRAIRSQSRNPGAVPARRARGVQPWTQTEV